MVKPARLADKEHLPKWNLCDLYPGPNSRELQLDLKSFRKNASLFRQKWQGKLVEIADTEVGGKTLANAIKEYEALYERAGRIFSYAYLYHAGNAIDPARSKFYGDVQNEMDAALTGLTFFELELNRIEDETLEAALRTENLARYSPWFDDLRKEKPHQLDDMLEKLFLEKSLTSSEAWVRLYNETMAALVFDINGDEQNLETTLSMMTSHVPREREISARVLSQVLKKNEKLLTHITNTLVKDKEITDRWHKFDDVDDSRHLSNGLEPAVVDALVEAVRSSYPKLSHRYYALKASWLGVAQIDYWDRNAPLFSSKNTPMPWMDAQTLVLESYRDFSPQMANIAQQFFDKNWIDAQPRKGKVAGAFAHPTVPSVHPYISLNYQGKFRDVMALAHELGHGIHHTLAAEQGILMSQTPVTLGETASVFGEMLTFQNLLEHTIDVQARKRMLALKIEDMLDAVVRQISIYFFERSVHLKGRKGELTSKQLAHVWMTTSKESLGPAIHLNSQYEIMWASIPHLFHSPFYVYAYAFGDCLVNSLYAYYKKDQGDFVEKYLDLLKAGGTKHHRELLQPFDLDVSDPAFWHLGLSLIQELIDELESLS